MNEGTTHYAGCFDAGPKHYECALMEITVLRKRLQTETQLLLDGNKIASKAHREEVANLRNQLEKKAWFSAYEKKEWVGLTGEEIDKYFLDNWARYYSYHGCFREVMRWQEERLKEKNT